MTNDTIVYYHIYYFIKAFNKFNKIDLKIILSSSDGSSRIFGYDSTNSSSDFYSFWYDNVYIPKLSIISITIKTPSLPYDYVLGIRVPPEIKPEWQTLELSNTERVDIERNIFEPRIYGQDTPPMPLRSFMRHIDDSDSDNDTSLIEPVLFPSLA